jgi:hypothetical protein
MQKFLDGFAEVWSSIIVIGFSALITFGIFMISKRLGLWGISFVIGFALTIWAQHRLDNKHRNSKKECSDSIPCCPCAKKTE